MMRRPGKFRVERGQMLINGAYYQYQGSGWKFSKQSDWTLVSPSSYDDYSPEVYDTPVGSKRFKGEERWVYRCVEKPNTYYIEAF